MINMAENLKTYLSKYIAGFKSRWFNELSMAMNSVNNSCWAFQRHCLACITDVGLNVVPLTLLLLEWSFASSFIIDGFTLLFRFTIRTGKDKWKLDVLITGSCGETLFNYPFMNC